MTYGSSAEPIKRGRFRRGGRLDNDFFKMGITPPRKTKQPKTRPEGERVILAMMKYRCGDPMAEEDYLLLESYLEGDKLPRRKEAPLISSLPRYAWNKRELAEQLSMEPNLLDSTLSLPRCPTRTANGRWPTRKIAQFMADYMKREGRGE